ncbi:MAG: endonuclease/exonuclease/phosphatase family protein [Verrucomicrobiaceae bacterium]|nr:endonuclease/exonuclease/phosphatase family protein [Verrucomicrobiaceae bacterium]
MKHMTSRSLVPLLVLLLAFIVTARSAEEFSFISYNLKNYLKMDRRINGKLHKQAGKPEQEILPLIHIIASSKPDVIGVSEMGDLDDFTDFKSRLAKAGLTYPHSELTLAADPVRHVGLLSRFPITASNSQTTLTYKIGKQELPLQRGILDVTIQPAKDYRLRLLGIHLKSKREVAEADQALMRRNEAELLRAHIDRIIKQSPEINLLVFGDFNETRNELPIKVIRGRYGSVGALTDIQISDDRGERWTYYWRYADQYSRFDFIFASKGLLPEINVEKSYIPTNPNWFLASDHRALVIKMSAEDR